ncbi:MAG: DNA polymerase III subunit beta [Actinomycetota bacterium]|nr:DNA polymerase III subunit beta [Actinomycetota bacterium]
MKLRCERDLLAEALGVVSRAGASRSTAGTLPGGVHLRARAESLEVTASDAEIEIDTAIAATALSEGSCVVPGRLFLDIVRALGAGALTLEADDDEVRIVAGRSQFNVRTSPEVELPTRNERATPRAELVAGHLAEALRQVVRAASSDAERPSLTGVLLAARPGIGLRLVATDSYRLALRDLETEELLQEGQTVLLPARSLGELQRLLLSGDPERKVGVAIGELEASFHLDEVRLASRLLRADFPNYEPLIPTSHPNRLEVSRSQFLEALRRVRLLVREQTASVKVTMGPGGVELLATSADVGQATEDMDAEFDGEEMTLAFNPSFLIDGIEGVTGDRVVIRIRDAGKPVLISSADSDDYRYVLMPILPSSRT